MNGALISILLAHTALRILSCVFEVTSLIYIKKGRRATDNAV